jgi:hypothetical protein
VNPARRGGSSSRVQMRKGIASAPAPLEADAPPQPEDYAEFLRQTLPQQAATIGSHRFRSERVWLKKAGPRHARLRYHLQGAAALLLRLDLMKPVPNPGGKIAIDIEARMLRRLGAAGLRVPQVLAQQPGGLLISDLGESGRPPVVLQERLDQAANSGPTALLSVWREGLAAIARVHGLGLYLSQAFDRNLVLCPDGAIGFIDFEDDPGDTLTLPECQVRDWLSYLHSTAMLVDAAAPHAAGAHWHAVLAAASDEVRLRLELAARRMRWLRHLPAGRRWGRDTQRVRAAASLLARWYFAQQRDRTPL